MPNQQHPHQSGDQKMGKPPLNLKRVGIIAAVVALAVVVIGISARARNDNVVRQWTDERAVPTVAVYQPRRDTSSHTLVLPGNLQSYFEAPIFARVNGYLKNWNVDIGARVKAGQLLAEIDTPELYQQLEQAKADLVSAESNEKLAEITARRWNNLRATDSVSQQEADQKQADLEVKKAAVAASQANVNRIQTLEAFRHIVAPFDGIVTARRTDVGALISAGSGTGVELFAVADVHKLRVFSHVPQIYSSQLVPGMSATLVVPEHPGQTFQAVLTTTSGAINSRSGTMLAELEVDNKDGLLTPGSYAEVKFDLKGNPQSMRVPASALILRRGGVQVATLDKDNRVVMKKLIIGLDFGSEVEVLASLTEDDRIVDSPPDSLEAGELVKVAAPPPSKPSSPTKGKE